MAHADAVKQPILSVTPLSPQDLHEIKNEFRPPTTSFSNIRSRFSRSQSPVHPLKPGVTAGRPKTSSGPAHRIEDFRGRDTKAKDDLTITSRTSAGTRGIVHDQGTTSFNFQLPSLQTPSKSREITILSRKGREHSASASPVPSLCRSRDTTPLGFREHRAKLERSRETSRHRNNSAGHDHRLPPRTKDKNEQVVASTTLQPEQLPIGMALGSPSQTPLNFQAMRPSRSETMPPPNRSNTSPPSQSYSQTQMPPQIANPTTSSASADKPLKVSKWKLFGMFGKKSVQEVSQDIDRFTQATTEETDPIKLEVTKGKVGRSRTITEKKSTRTLKRERPGLGRVTTAPTASEESYARDVKAVPFTGVHVFEESVEDVLANVQLDANNAQNERRPSLKDSEGGSSQGLLAVDIPSIQMERYSVMFSQLLELTKDSPKKISTSNLLARRQATLDRLKTVNESIAELELEEARLGGNLQRPRRMTSPMASPSLSLYPGGLHLTPSAAAAAAGNPSQRLHRSNTSPAMLSPNRMTFPTEARPKPSHSRPEQWTERNLVASPTSTVSDDTGPPTPDKHAQIVSVGMKSRTIQEPEWEMLDGSTTSIRMRQRSNTSHAKNRLPAQRVRASTTTHHQPPMASPRTSGSSSISGSGSMASAASSTSTATTISSSSNQAQRPIPKIKIRHKPSLEPYPSGIVPGVPGGAAVNPSTSSLNVAASASGSGTSTPREGGHPERGSSRPQPVPAAHSQDDVMKVGMRIPISRFSTAPARRLPAEAPKPDDETNPEDEELQIRTAADVSIARQISISRQQSQMLKQRLARGERQRRGEQGLSDKEKERGERLGRRGEKERDIRNAIDDRGGLFQRQQRGLMPLVVEGGNRKSEYGVLEGE